MPQPSRAKPPDPPDLPEELEALDGEFASAADPVVGALLRDLSLPSRKSIGLRLRECRLERTTLRESDLSSSVWRDVALRDCDLAGVRLEAAEWHRAEVAGGRLTGVTGPQMKLCQVAVGEAHTLELAEAKTRVVDA